MEMAMNMGAFKELDQQEMLEVDGGDGLLLGLFVSAIVDGALKATTGQGLSDWVAVGIKGAAQTIKRIKIIQPAYTNP